MKPQMILLFVLLLGAAALNAQQTHTVYVTVNYPSPYGSSCLIYARVDNNASAVVVDNYIDGIHVIEAPMFYSPGPYVHAWVTVGSYTWSAKVPFTNSPSYITIDCGLPPELENNDDPETP